MQYEIRYKNGHVEIYGENGGFLFSADTVEEAMREMDEAV